jgi:hypothetical protein
MRHGPARYRNGYHKTYARYKAAKLGRSEYIIDRLGLNK